MASYSSSGVILAIGDAASPEVFTDVAAIFNINGVGFTTTKVDVATHNDVVATGFADQFVLAAKKGGDIDLELIWDNANATHKTAANSVYTLAQARTKFNFKVKFENVSPTLSTPICVGGFISFMFDTPLEGAWKLKGKLAVTYATNNFNIS